MTDPINFNGSNWHDLTRLVIATKLEFIQDAALDDDSQRYATQQSKCAKLASSFTGPALDWVGHTYETNNALFTDYNNFILTIRNALPLYLALVILYFLHSSPIPNPNKATVKSSSFFIVSLVLMINERQI